jgi:hypothetical protein
MVSPRLRAGAPKKKEVDWDDDLKEKVMGLVLSSDFDWTVKAKLAPEQIKANDRVLDVLEEMARLETGPNHIGHLLRVPEDKTRIPYPDPSAQIQGKLGKDMTIRDVLRQLPISLWRPARPGQCFHPECAKSKADMAKTDHLSMHARERDWVKDALGAKLKASYLFDGESCLTATTASLLNVMVVTPQSAKYSDAYKLEMGIEKQINTIAGLQNTWDQEGKAQWHHQVGDFWGPIMTNLHAGGTWLTIEEIFKTGSEHRFYPKEVSEEGSWKRISHFEPREDDDTAIVLYNHVSMTYSGRDFGDFSVHQLLDLSKIQERVERQHLAEELNQEDQERLDHELNTVLDAGEAPEPMPVRTEITDWVLELQNAWINFAQCLNKSGLNQRVAVESLVRYRRAQWIQMTKEQRDLYTVWKNQRYATARPDQVRIRDLIMSPDCLYLPPSHYACPICWISQTIHKEATAAGMRQHCFEAHSIQAKSCYDPFTLALGKMIGKDVILQAEYPDLDGGPPKMTTVRGNYLQCYHRGCQHKAVNGVGIRDHLEKSHHSHDSLDMGGWDIIMEHLKHNPELTPDDLFEKKSGIVCQAQNCGFVGATEKELIAHNLQQHQNQEKWTKATLKAQLGVAPAIPNLENPELALADARKSYLERMPGTTKDAQIAGMEWRELTWKDFENGIREKHPTRSEARRIAEEGPFKKFIEEELLPHWQIFQNCSFEAQEGLMEAELQLMRAKFRSVKGSIGTMFGPKKVPDEKEVERRRVVAEQARTHYQLLKATQLVLEAINWRVVDRESLWEIATLREGNAHFCGGHTTQRNSGAVTTWEGLELATQDHGCDSNIAAHNISNHL